MEARIRRYCGPIIASYDNRYIREYCGPILYEVEGNLDHDEWMMVVAFLFAK